jgi:glycosyl transferase family 1
MIDGAFAGGDYLSAARHLSSDSWQYWASLGLIGHPADAAEALDRFTDPNAVFFSGVASWIAGDDDRARHVLRRCEGAHARRLANLIAKRPITVVAQLPWNRRGAWDILTHLKDPAFRLLNVSFHPKDVQNRPYADIRMLIPRGVMPDFYAVEMLEWHLIPPNVRMLGCPVLGHSSDFDLHIQTVAPWLELFDELIVLDHAEWRDMSRAVRVPVSVFPKVFGVPDQFPALVERERDVDVFLSGTITHPYHHDKDPIVLDILRMPDIRLRMVQGFEALDTYYQNLAASKVCCTFVRHAGAMPTRGLEALGMGCAVVVQEESALRLFASQNEGVVPYRADGAGLTDAIQTVLAGWDTFGLRARRGAEIVRREFALDRVASQYLRFLTFLAARPRTPRPGPDPEQLVQKRPVVHKGWLPSYGFSNGLLMEWASASAARLERRLDVQETAGLLNDLARERLLAHYHDQANAWEWLGSVVTPLERACEQFPSALVPRFNLMRILLHFGDPERVRRGVRLIDDTLRRPAHWQLDPLDDVLPWDFCPSWFNYRRYFDAVTRGMDSPCGDVTELVAVILASLNHYRARYADEIVAPRSKLELAAEAVGLDPDFPDYALYYCRLLIARADPADLHQASTQLRRLAWRSARLLEILDVARHLPEALLGEWFEDLERQAARLWSAAQIREDLSEPALRSALAAGGQTTPGTRVCR